MSRPILLTRLFDAISSNIKRTFPLDLHNQSAATFCQPMRPLEPEGTDPHIERREPKANAVPACFSGITVLGKPEKPSLPVFLEHDSFDRCSLNLAP